MKFNKYNVTDGKIKARVRYSHGLNVQTNKNMITLYEKDYGRNLSKLFDHVENETDIMTDYFDENKVRFHQGTSEYDKLLIKLIEWGVTTR